MKFLAAAPAHLVTFTLAGLLAAAGLSHAEEPAQKVRTVGTETEAHPPAATYEQHLSAADALIRAGKPADAYALLEPLEFDHAGEVRFDYLIGIAALDSGRPDRATFAFERVLAVNPDFTPARLDMARAYYQLGDFQRARTEFGAVLKQNPPEKARASIQKYLDTIDARIEGRRTRIAAYVEGSAGRDSNVNYSTSQQHVFVDRFATIATIDPSNVQAADSYYSAAAGGEIGYSLNAAWGLHLGVDMRKRHNGTHSQFDASSLDARAGVTYETRTDRARAVVLSGQQDVGGSPNNDTTGFRGEWRHVFSPSNQLDGFIQQVQYRFADPLMRPNDFDQRAIGLGWVHVMANGRSSLSGSVHYGTEQDVSPAITVASPSGGRNDGGKRFGGLRVSGQTAPDERTILFASAGMQAGDYDKVNYYFQRQRNDRLRDMSIGVTWRWSKLWTLRPQLSYTRNGSNISIYEYERKDVSLTVRRDFR